MNAGDGCPRNREATGPICLPVAFLTSRLFYPLRDTYVTHIGIISEMGTNSWNSSRCCCAAQWSNKASMRRKRCPYYSYYYIIFLFGIKINVLRQSNLINPNQIACMLSMWPQNESVFLTAYRWRIWSHSHEIIECEYI